jgi:hypothetical protein
MGKVDIPYFLTLRMNKKRLKAYYDRFCRFFHLGCGYCGGEVTYMPHGTVCGSCKRRTSI